MRGEQRLEDLPMSATKDGFAPFGSTGIGEYGDSLGKVSAYALTSTLRERIFALIKTIPFPDKKSVFSIGDYGTADGAASMTFIRDLILILKEQHGSEVQFQVIYEDQDINDFNSLFKRLSGIIPDPPSYLSELNNVYPLASGTEFRKQCVPSDSMHFIMSMMAVQWLDQLPVLYKDSLLIYPSSSHEEKEALYTRARTDWESFLLLRSKELKKGGIILVTTTGEYETDNGTSMHCAKIIICILTHVWKMFRDSGKITADEFLNTNIKLGFYSIEQLKEPFDDPSSAVSKSGLRLEFVDVKSIPYAFYNSWKERKNLTGIDDQEEFAKAYVTAHRKWSNNTFLYGLSDSRSPEEKEVIVNELFQLVQAKVTEMNPEEFRNDYVIAYAIIKKD